MKRLGFAGLALLILAVTFFSGTYVGSRDTLRAASFDAVVNRENPLASKVDFAPFWKVWTLLNEKYVSNKAPVPGDQERVYGAIQGLAASLGDPYTVFFPPAEAKMFESDIAGNFEGVGMEVANKDGILTVVSPIKGSPAFKAGIKPGDKILKINATSTLDMTVEKAVSFIRGAKGTPVNLTVLREGVKASFEVKIVRDVIDMPIVEYAMGKDGVYVIRLYSFSANSINLFRGALREFAKSGTTKLVLDLRGNPGGYLDAAVDMASYFLPAGKTIVSEDFGKKGGNKIYRSKGYGGLPSSKIVVLVDAGSASAAEILAGALQENYIAQLVGTKTFGKGSVQELIPVTADTSLKVTVARWLTPKGNSISEGGLTPDFEVKITPADLEKKLDPQLDKAVDLLNGR